MIEKGDILRQLCPRLFKLIERTKTHKGGEIMFCFIKKIRQQIAERIVNVIEDFTKKNSAFIKDMLFGSRELD